MLVLIVTNSCMYTTCCVLWALFKMKKIKLQWWFTMKCEYNPCQLRALARATVCSLAMGQWAWYELTTCGSFTWPHYRGSCYCSSSFIAFQIQTTFWTHIHTTWAWTALTWWWLSWLSFGSTETMPTSPSTARGRSSRHIPSSWEPGTGCPRKKNFLSEFFSSTYLNTNLGNSGNFWQFWAILGIFWYLGHFGHTWAFWKILGNSGHFGYVSFKHHTVHLFSKETIHPHSSY